MKVKVKFFLLEIEEIVELDLEDNWTYLDIEDAFDEWIREQEGYWEILE